MQIYYDVFKRGIVASRENDVNYHKFSHGAAFYAHNGINVIAMLE